MRYHCMARIQWPFILHGNGGLLADRYLGYRWAILGALAMTLGCIYGSRDAFVLYIRIGF
jgi:dipeptide/tripeptide permease